MPAPHAAQAFLLSRLSRPVLHAALRRLPLLRLHMRTCTLHLCMLPHLIVHPASRKSPRTSAVPHAALRPKSPPRHALRIVEVPRLPALPHAALRVVLFHCGADRQLPALLLPLPGTILSWGLPSWRRRLVGTPTSVQADQVLPSDGNGHPQV